MAFEYSLPLRIIDVMMVGAVVLNGPNAIVLVPEDLPPLSALVIGPARLVAVRVVGVGLPADVDSRMRLLLGVHVSLLVGSLLLFQPN